MFVGVSKEKKKEKDKGTVEDKGENQNCSHLLSISEPDTGLFFTVSQNVLEF